MCSTVRCCVWIAGGDAMNKVSAIEILVFILIVAVICFVAKQLVIPSIYTLMTCDDTVVRGVFKLECIKVIK